MSLTKGTVQYVTPSHTFILQIFPPPPTPHFSNPHHRNPFFKIFVHPRKTFILSALPADVNCEGKATRPLCFLLLIFQPCLFGQIYARFSSHHSTFDTCFIPVSLSPKTGSIPRFLFRHLLTSSTTPALANSPHTGLFYLSSISSSLRDEKSNVGANWATRGEATFLGVNENKRP